MADNSDKNNQHSSVKIGSRKAIVVAGPTASGKSGLALKLASEINGIIINADSMQVYENLPMLTARPSKEDCEKIPHKLYGFLGAYEKCNAAEWVLMAAREMEKAFAAGKTPIIVGGTGLYIQTLQHGIASIPDVSDETKQKCKKIFEEKGIVAVYELLKAHDPQFAPRDSQRVLRAYEVLEETGLPIGFWQKQPLMKPIEAKYFSVFLDPPREILYKNCDQRLLTMLKQGALEELKAFLKASPPPDCFIMNALGAREFADYLSGKTAKEQALERACQMTRNYAKRQLTWFRNRFRADETAADAKETAVLTKVLRFLS